MVDGQDGEDDVERMVLKRQRFRNRSRCGGGRTSPLPEHDNRWLDGDNAASVGFV
jgi:hypothetical protein